MSLYSLTSEHLALRQYLESTQDDPQVIADTLEAESSDLEEKIESYGFVIKELEADYAAQEAAAHEMIDRYVATKKQIERLKAALINTMTAIKRDKFTFKYFDIKVKANPSSVEIDDETKIPSQFWRTPVPVQQVDKKAIKEAIKAGQAVPGAREVNSCRVEIK
jgi:hypothetical protein